jgi:hypothetical protein
MNTAYETVLEKFRRQDKPSFDSEWLASPEMYSSLFERLEHEAEQAREEARQQAHARAWELAKQQGVVPIRDIKELQGDFWPEDESVDEFLDWVRETRQQDKVGAEE